MRNGNEGSILIMTLAFVLIFTLLGFGAIYFASLQHELASKEQMSAQAFWLADAGIERAKTHFKTAAQSFNDGANPDSAYTHQILGSDGEYTVAAKKIPNPDIPGSYYSYMWDVESLGCFKGNCDRDNAEIDHKHRRIKARMSGIGEPGVVNLEGNLGTPPQGQGQGGGNPQTCDSSGDFSGGNAALVPPNTDCGEMVKTSQDFSASYAALETAVNTCLNCQTQSSCAQTCNTCTQTCQSTCLQSCQSSCVTANCQSVTACVSQKCESVSSCKTRNCQGTYDQCVINYDTIKTQCYAACNNLPKKGQSSCRKICDDQNTVDKQTYCEGPFNQCSGNCQTTYDRCVADCQSSYTGCYSSCQSAPCPQCPTQCGTQCQAQCQCANNCQTQCQGMQTLIMTQTNATISQTTGPTSPIFLIIDATNVNNAKVQFSGASVFYGIVWIIGDVKITGNGSNARIQGSLFVQKDGSGDGGYADLGGDSKYAFDTGAIDGALSGINLGPGTPGKPTVSCWKEVTDFTSNPDPCN
jgi:hypothetical protein